MNANTFLSAVLTLIAGVLLCSSIPELVAIGVFTMFLAIICWYKLLQDIDKNKNTHKATILSLQDTIAIAEFNVYYAELDNIQRAWIDRQTTL